jgi:DNA-binding NtrC family response regulator
MRIAPCILMASSDAESRRAIAESLRGTQFLPVFAGNIGEGAELLRRLPVCLILCEENLPDGGYQELLRETEDCGAAVPLVVLSRAGEWDEYLRAIRLGAMDMITPPYHRSIIQALLRRVFQESAEWKVSVHAEAEWRTHLNKDVL